MDITLEVITLHWLGSQLWANKHFTLHHPKLGYPYLWAKICCFFSPENQTRPSSKHLTGNNVQEVAKFNIILSKPKVFTLWWYSTVKKKWRRWQAATDDEWMRLSFDFGAIFTQAFNIGAGCHINIFSVSESWRWKMLGWANFLHWETGLDFRMTNFHIWFIKEFCKKSEHRTETVQCSVLTADLQFEGFRFRSFLFQAVHSPYKLADNPLSLITLYLK